LYGVLAGKVKKKGGTRKKKQGGGGEISLGKKEKGRSKPYHGGVKGG